MLQCSIRNGSYNIRGTYLLLKALDYLTDEPAGYAVRLDHDEGLLGVCHVARLALSDASFRYLIGRYH